MVSTPKVVPGPRGRLILGSFAEYRRDPLHFFLAAALQYGDLVRFRIAHKRNVFLVTHPDYIRHILQDNLRNYVKGVSYEALRLALGQGLLVSEGELWKRQRRLLQPHFTPQKMAEKVGTMTGCISAMLDRWRTIADSGRPFDLVTEVMRLAFDIVGKTLMGAEIGEEMVEVERVLHGLTDYVYRRMEAPVKLPTSLPTPRNRLFRNGMTILNRVVSRVIDKHRGAAEPGRSLLSVLMAARDPETGQGMSGQQLRDEVLTLLLAGHETSGDAIAWTFYLLSLHPAVERTLHEEIRTVLGDRVPAAEDLMRLPYAGQVVQEAMRRYPPAGSFTRTPLADDTIDGYRIPKNAVIILSPYVNHRLPKFWENPEAFDPDRFAPERAEALPPYVYFPFGGGPHTCIGRNLSLVEVAVATAMIVQRYRLHLVPAQKIYPEPRISLRPQPAIQMTLHRR